MRMKKEKVPAHREYFLTLVRTNGKREQWYLPYVFDSPAQAQARADERNKHYKHGTLIVEYVDRPASVCWSGSLAIRL